MPNPPDPKLAIHSLALLLLKWDDAAKSAVESVDSERVDVGASGSYADIVERSSTVVEKIT